ncbi:MAG: GLPGLI family protein [Flavicella sp.]
MRFQFYMYFMFLCMCTLYSQEFQGKAVFASKTPVSLNFGNSKIPENIKKKIMKRRREYSQKTFEFYFDKKASIYKEQVKLETGEGRSDRGRMYASMFGGAMLGEYYKNTSEKNSIRSVEFFGKDFLIEEPLKPFAWKLVKETKQIGKYTCFKAIASIEQPVKVPFYRKKEKDTVAKDNPPTIETVLVTAWYTPQIPVSTGPSNYWGLPGMILGVQSSKEQLWCTKIVLNVKEKKALKAPKRGKKISQEDFDFLVKERTQEMREQYRNKRSKKR